VQGDHNYYKGCHVRKRVIPPQYQECPTCGALGSDEEVRQHGRVVCPCGLPDLSELDLDPVDDAFNIIVIPDLPDMSTNGELPDV
jgi:hypothetical protein